MPLARDRQPSEGYPRAALRASRGDRNNILYSIPHQKSLLLLLLLLLLLFKIKTFEVTGNKKANKPISCKTNNNIQ